MLDPNEAPEGFTAVEMEDKELECTACAFFSDLSRCTENSCADVLRKDNTEVIFKEKK